MLTGIVWPCILASRNLPEFTRECRVVYRICTTRRDQQKLRELTIFHSVSNLVPIVFIDTPTEHPEPAFHMDRFVAAMQEARQDGAIFFNLWPDVVFPDRILGNAARAIRDGRSGCILPSFRVVSETCVDDVITSFATSPDSPISIAPGELVRLGARHMHPLSATGAASAVHGRPDTGLLFRIPGEGFVSRSSFNWLFIDPQRLGITADGAVTTSELAADQLIHIVSDSDDMFFLSLAPLYKELDTFRPNHPNDALDIVRLTMLPHVKVSPFLDPVDRTCVRLHYGDMTETVWAPVVHRSELAFRRVRTMRALMRIWELLKDEGCQQAARLISLALFTLKLSRDWLTEAPVTIFVPTDHAIESLPSGKFARLLDRRSRGDLLRTMLGHTVLGADSIPTHGDAEHRTLIGSRIQVRALEADIRINRTGKVLRDLRCGGHRICVIDQVLDAGSPAAAA